MVRRMVASACDYLLSLTTSEGGVPFDLPSWPISWPAPSPLAELEWRGSGTVTALLTLRAYGRIA